MPGEEVSGQRPGGNRRPDWRRPRNLSESADGSSTDWAKVVVQGEGRSYSKAAQRALRTSSEPAISDEEAAGYIAGLPANQTRYATELWEWVSGRGLSCPRQTSDTFKNMLTWGEAQAILNTFYRKD